MRANHHLPVVTDTGKTIEEDARLMKRRDLAKTMALDSITIASLEGLTLSRLGANEWKYQALLNMEPSGRHGCHKVPSW